MADTENNKNSNSPASTSAPALRFPGFTEPWRKCFISQLGDIITGNTPSTKQSENYSEDGYLWASPSDLNVTKYVYDTKTRLSQIGFQKTRIIPKHSILVTCIGSTIGKMGMASTVMSTNQQINAVVVNSSFDKDFVYYAIQSRFPKYLSSIAVQAVPILSKSTFCELENYYPSKIEQTKIGELLSLLDERIATQRRLIEDLEKLKSSIIDKCYRGTDHIQLGDFITQISNRNKSNLPYKVMSVSNVRGFVPQFEQFADREIASENTTSYKIVTRNIFAYNPARINIGSIARFKGHDNGIISPMYVCFKVEGELQPQFLEYFFQTRKFKNDVEIRLEGSVRRCLNFDALCEIEIPLLSLSKQIVISSALETVSKKIAIENGCSISYYQTTQISYI